MVKIGWNSDKGRDETEAIQLSSPGCFRIDVHSTAGWQPGVVVVDEMFERKRRNSRR